MCKNALLLTLLQIINVGALAFAAHVVSLQTLIWLLPVRMWELLILLVIVIGIGANWWDYSTAVQEYTFAKPATLDKRDDIRALLAEKTPIAVEIGSLPWRPELATTATWTVSVEADGAVLDMPMSQWLEGGGQRSPIANQEALANEMELTTGIADIDGARPWWWLPGLWDVQVNILAPGQVQGLTWVSSERHWIGCTHGTPLTLWLVHNRYRRFLPTASGFGSGSGSVDPWALTVATAPWIGKVQYIEVTIKPGWCIGLPAHWGFAVRPSGDAEAWIWTAKQHSPLSHVMTTIFS